MKKIIQSLFSIVLATTAFAQKETFDLVTYTPPAGWTKGSTETSVHYTVIDAQTKAWCQVVIIKSTISKGNIEQDFANEWQELIVKNYKPTGNADVNEVQDANGWKIKAGNAKFSFNGSDAVVLLTTASGFDRCVSVVATTNTQDYLKEIEAFLSSLDLIKPEATGNEHPDIPGAIGKENAWIVGTWGVGTTIASTTNFSINEGSIITQYTFNANGTYSFYIKTFRYQLDRLLLTRETGIYEISGNKITITPKKSAIESWSKKDGTDKWGKLISSQKKDLEKVTYQFFKQDLGLGPMLVLKANPTKRDGAYNNNDKNAWLYPTVAPVSYLELPNGQKLTDVEVEKETAKPAANNNNAEILGTWTKSGSVNPSYHDAYATSIAGYTKDQYVFAANGTYTFTSKTFRMSYDKILLVRETGIYEINGSNITITPKKSVLEAWTKKDGGDSWGKLVSTDQRSLEKVTYQFTKHYFTGIQQWNLVLLCDKPTKRDGPFSNNKSFENAWYFVPLSANSPVIDLP